MSIDYLVMLQGVAAASACVGVSHLIGRKLIDRFAKAFHEFFDDFVGIADASLASVIDTLAGSQNSKITKPPGYWLTMLLGKWLSKSFIGKTFGQTIADARSEHAEALANGDLEEAKKIERELNRALIRTIVEMIAGLPADLLVAAVKRVFKKDE